jgi:hypothetical protein
MTRILFSCLVSIYQVWLSKQQHFTIILALPIQRPTITHPFAVCLFPGSRLAVLLIGTGGVSGALLKLSHISGKTRLRASSEAAFRWSSIWAALPRDSATHRRESLPLLFLCRFHHPAVKQPVVDFSAVMGSQDEKRFTRSVNAPSTCKKLQDYPK